MIFLVEKGCLRAAFFCLILTRPKISDSFEYQRLFPGGTRSDFQKNPEKSVAL
jgi:hypothetical protein